MTGPLWFYIEQGEVTWSSHDKEKKDPAETDFPERTFRRAQKHVFCPILGCTEPGDQCVRAFGRMIESRRKIYTLPEQKPEPVRRDGYIMGPSSLGHNNKDMEPPRKRRRTS